MLRAFNMTLQLLMFTTLIVLSLFSPILSAPAGISNQSEDVTALNETETIDELLAKSGDMAHGKNPGGRFDPSGKRTKDGKSVIIEYDIAVIDSEDEPKLDEKIISCGFGRKKRQAVGEPEAKWSGGIIPYTIDSGFSSTQVDNIKQAVNIINENTCVQWVNRKSEKDYIVFSSEDDGCYSHVGHTGLSNGQPINLGGVCSDNVNVILHVMMHAMGVYHEQSRSDRDQYVTINYENIHEGAHNNFKIQENSNNYNTTYDYNSIMHYGQYEYSKNLQPTIITTDESYQDVIGRATQLSDKDIELVKAMYEC